MLCMLFMQYSYVAVLSLLKQGGSKLLYFLSPLQLYTNFQKGWPPGEVVCKHSVTALLEYFIVTDCFSKTEQVSNNVTKRHHTSYKIEPVN